MIKKLEFQKMVFCLFLIVPLIAGTAATVYGNAFENPNQKGDTIDYVGKSMSGYLTAILVPEISGTLLPEFFTDVSEYPVGVTWIFIGECGKVVFAFSEIERTSDFATFDSFSDELVGTAIPASFLIDDPHPCFPADDPTTGDLYQLIITSAKKIKKVINYGYTTLPDSPKADQVKALFPQSVSNRIFPPYGFIGAQVTVRLAIVVPAEE